MKIELNGDATEIAAEASINAVVHALTGEETPKGIAVAVNGTVVRRQLWASTVLNDGDKVEIVRAMAGG